MSLVTIRISQELMNKTNQIARSLKVSRNEYIRKSILTMNESIKQQELRAQLTKSSKLVRKNSMQVNKDFDEIEYE